MPKIKSLSKIALILILLLPLFTATLAFAQAQSTDVSFVYDITDSKAESDDILIADKNQGIVRANHPYDYQLFGVLQSQPLLVYRRIDNQGKAVARNGITTVNVTTLGGPIKAGDYITSSEIPGKGMKAGISGYVIGVALTSFSDQDGQPMDYAPASTPNETKKIAAGKITIALKIEYAELTTSRSTSTLMTSFNSALYQNMQDPGKFVQVLRYIAAAVTVLISFGVGFVTFSRSIPKGVEAVGRNPLAQKAIMFSMILNIIFTILTASVGVLVAALILRIWGFFCYA